MIYSWIISLDDPFYEFFVLKSSEFSKVCDYPYWLYDSNTKFGYLSWESFFSSTFYNFIDLDFEELDLIDI